MRACRLGFVPAVLFGRKKKQRKLIAVKLTDLETLIAKREGAFENTLLTVHVDGATFVVLARSLLIGSRKNRPLGVSFERYDPERGAHVNVPIVFTDRDKNTAIKRGALLNQIHWSVRCHIKGGNFPSAFFYSVAGKGIGAGVSLSVSC